MQREKEATASIGMKISRPVDALWQRISDKTGLSKTAVFTVAIREMARREGVALDLEETEGKTNQ